MTRITRAPRLVAGYISRQKQHNEDFYQGLPCFQPNFTLGSVISHVIATKPGWHVCTGRVKYDVDLELTAALKGPRAGGAGMAADASGGSQPREHTPEAIK